VVKIQYPNIGRTIKEDIKNLKLSAFGMRFSGDWQNLLLQYKGIQAMFEKEIDYKQEAQFQTSCREALAGLEDVVVAKVYEDHSTDRVLTMDYQDGLHLDEFLATNPSQELRDHFGILIVQALTRLWYQEPLVYADPHPGNFLFLPDGRLGLIDFGCCHRFSDDEFDYVMEIEEAARQEDKTALRAAMAKGCDLEPEGIVGERADLIQRYTDWTWGPILQKGPFDYGVPGQYAEGVKIYGEFIKKRYVRSQPINV
jgi:aarF domain-containing kinase